MSKNEKIRTKPPFDEKRQYNTAILEAKLKTTAIGSLARSSSENLRHKLALDTDEIPRDLLT